jgi:tetratricopeptide (TPR) repeat protein
MPRPIHPDPLIICPPDDLVRTNPNLARMSRRLANKYADRQVVTDDDLRSMGRLLWNSLAVQTAFQAAQRDAGRAILPLIIESRAAEIQSLPWETLYHPEHGFLGRHPSFTLTRRIGPTNDTAIQFQKGPLRVLLFTSLPEDANLKMGRLNVEEEQFQVQEALLPWIANGLVQLEMPDDGRFSTLEELLLDFQPQVLFLSGHGRFQSLPHTGEAYGEFFFESKAGDSQAIREEQLANALSGTGLQAVILTACESGKAAPEALSNGLLRHISAQGLPHVIGMREAILDTAGIAFTRSLCDALAKQESMDVALQCARQNIAESDNRAQWCLPILISSNPHMPLIDWDFQPGQSNQEHNIKNTLGDVRLPSRFIGRRAELRQHKNRLFKGQFHKLLITGPGGQGKTALAGKLALDLQQRGWQLFTWSTRLNKSWHDFELQLEQTLEKLRLNRYNEFWHRAENEQQRAKCMLNLLMEQFNGRVILFLDNLESVQDPDSGGLNDAHIAAWVDAARGMQDLTLIATSRFQIPSWDGEHLMLAHACYGDFLQMAQAVLPSTVLKRRDGLRQIYEVLGGNCRGLEFFAAAVRNIKDPTEQRAFLNVLEHSKVDLQANMAIAEIYRRLSPDAQTLLRRLPGYHEPVPREGLLRLANDLPDREELLERLLSVSLLDASYEPHRKVTHYQCNSLTRDWLDGHQLTDNDPIWLNIAGSYHLDLLDQEVKTLQSLQKQLSGAERLTQSLQAQERKTLDQAFAAYYALRRAGRHSEADRLALDHIVEPLTRAGSYQRLLTEFLPRICESKELQTRGRALMYTGSLLHSTGDYEQALSSHKEALVIMQQTGDQAGAGLTLNNMAMTYKGLSDYEKALENLKRAMSIQQRIQDEQGLGLTLSNMAQIFQAQSDYEAALKNLDQVLNTQRQIGDRAGESTTLNNMATIFLTRGEYGKALDYLNQAFVIQQQIGDRAGESVILNNISGIYQRQGDYDSALKYLKRALIIEQQIGGKAGKATTLNNLSGIYRRQGDYTTSSKYLQETLAIQQQIGDIAGEATTLNNIASAHQMQGEYETALMYFEQALVIRKKIGDRAGVAQSLNNIATIQQGRGDYNSSLESLKQLLIITRELGSKLAECGTLNNMATVYQVQKDYRVALEYLQEALAIAQQIGNQMAESVTLHNIASIYESQGDLDGALLKYQQALAIRQKIGDQSGESQTLSGLSQIYRSKGDNEKAWVCLKRALVMQQQIGNKPGQCITLISMGHMHLQNGQVDDARLAWGNAYILARQMNLRQVLDDLAELAPLVGLDGWEEWVQNQKKQE